jgi:hypothetical protein
MYRIVVVRSAWPASSWIAFAGAPRIARCEQNVWRRDLLLGDERAGVLVELKIRASEASAFDRLVGQARKYLHLWKGRGPMISVLCKTDPAGIASRLQREIESMRRDGYAVVAVFAMP